MRFARRVAHLVVGRTEWNLRRHIRATGGRLPATAPQLGWMNSVLKTTDQLEAALREVDRCGLSRHPERAKNWDAVSTVGTILERTDRSARILEVGARSYSVILPWLYQYGYRNLTGIDVVYRQPIQRGPIRYEFGDIRRTRFAAQSFDAICSLSVIEHGIDVAEYFAEAARLLVPGGLLITSTDCWQDPVDTRGQRAYGHPIKVFTIDEIAAMLQQAERQGLRPTSVIDFACRDRVVRWQRYELDFTFVCFALVRDGSRDSSASTSADIPRRQEVCGD